MGRTPRAISSQFPYHISARCTNRDWFRLPIEKIWEIFSSHLFAANRFYELKIHAFVLMNNHFHLIATTPLGNISECMRYLMTETSREITFLSRRINQTYGGPYHSSLINSYHYFMHAYKYVYRNPVEAKLAERVEEYQFSTLFGLLGSSQLVIPVEEDTLLFGGVTENLKWLNTGYKRDEDRKTLKLALRRSVFQLPRERSKRIKSPLETELS